MIIASRFYIHMIIITYKLSFTFNFYTIKCNNLENSQVNLIY